MSRPPVSRPLRLVNKLGYRFVSAIQIIGLLVVAISTVIAFGIEIKIMIDAGRVDLADLLLMFIYLEVLAMAAIYFSSGVLPVRIPLYIAIVALARYLILDMKSMDAQHIIGIAVATLVLALTVFVIRFGHIRFPYEKHDDL